MEWYGLGRRAKKRRKTRSNNRTEGHKGGGRGGGTKQISSSSFGVGEGGEGEKPCRGIQTENKRPSLKPKKRGKGKGQKNQKFWTPGLFEQSNDQWRGKQGKKITNLLQLKLKPKRSSEGEEGG